MKRRAGAVAVRASPSLSVGALLCIGVVLAAAASAQVVPVGIVFESNRSGTYQVYTMNPSGTNVTELTQFPTQRENFDPAWSRDGRRIAFESDRKNQNASDVWAMNADGSGSKQLTLSPDADRNPAWSPDGKRIVFQSNRSGSYQLYVVRSFGGPARQLTTKGQNFDPAWSPDGKRIAFDSTRDRDQEIYVMNEDGSRQTRMTKSPGDDDNPAWSPSGKQIAFQTNRDGNDEIYVMAVVAGSRQVNITGNPARDADPTWSPNGRSIAFDTNRDGNDEIYVMNANGSRQTRLTADPADDLVPNW